nr:3-dehydroquinate dehydratase [Paenibacillus sp. MSJ-34]
MIPVFYTTIDKKTLISLKETLERKFVKGKKLVKKCLDSLISIEIVGCEAILHTKHEGDTLALSLR